MNKKKVLVAGAVILLIGLFFLLDLDRFLTLDYLQGSLDRFHAFYAENRLLTLAVFFLIYVVVTALSLPGAAVMTLAGGAFFGLITGVIVVSFASTIGATLAFMVARFLLKDTIQNRFADRLKAINEGVRKDGAFYLFTLRLVPVFPFFLINLVMALTPIRTWTFYWISQVGMLAGTIVYVNAGTQLAGITTTGDLLSFNLIGAFVLLGLFPWIARAIVNRIHALRVYSGWKKPKQFDRNLIVIGAGSAGLVTAYIAATVKASVSLVEKGAMGGDCLNTGCVPSKALIKSARVNSYIRRAGDFGLNAGPAEVDFARVMKRVHSVIEKIAPHDSEARYQSMGVDVRKGSARLVSPWEVEIEESGKTTRLSAQNIVIATGGEPMAPPIPGLDQIDYLTSDTLWEITELPERLLVLGGGPIGCELAQSFARLGSHVTLVEMADRVLVREDPEASALLAREMTEDGVDLRLGYRAAAFEKDDSGVTAVIENKDGQVRISSDKVLVALGRKGHSDGLGLNALGITLNPNGTVAVNEYLETRFPNIRACGDVAGPYQFTHTAAHQAWFAAVNSLFGRFKKFKVDYRVIPWCTFTTPEVARVGINEQEAAEKGISFEVTRYGIDELDRAIADGVDIGFVKVLTAPGTDRILGVTIVGEHAGDLIAEYVLAMKHKLGLNKILGTIHIYPTLAEANKSAAGEWKKTHAPQRLLEWIGWYLRRRLKQ